jgi:hypothetical protein
VAGRYPLVPRFRMNHKRYFMKDWVGKIEFCAERINILRYLAQKMAGKRMDLQRT